MLCHIWNRQTLLSRWDVGNSYNVPCRSKLLIFYNFSVFLLDEIKESYFLVVFFLSISIANAYWVKKLFTLNKWKAKLDIIITLFSLNNGVWSWGATWRTQHGHQTNATYNQTKIILRHIWRIIIMFMVLIHFMYFNITVPYPFYHIYCGSMVNTIKPRTKRI